jgi:antitoxin (DNA-binding transcriptional repressor) of toxin-antitoxin stability system
MQTKTVDVHEAQTHLVELLSLVTAGIEIILTEGSTPLARIVPMGGASTRASPTYILVPSGPARTLTSHCLRNSGQARQSSTRPEGEVLYRQVSSGGAVWTTAAEQEYRMKELRIMVSDEEGAELEHLAQALGVTLEELLKRSVAAYLPQVKAELTFEPIGFGMWADRPEMQDAAKWVADLRERQWKR